MAMTFSDGIFTADYRDGCVYLGGKKYPAGYFVLQFLNQYYVNDTAARIAVFSDGITYNIRRQLRCGYLNIEEYEKTGRNTLESLKALPWLRPFDTLDVDAMRKQVAELFTEENGERICEYFRSRDKISETDQNLVGVGVMNWRCDLSYVEEMEALLSEVNAILAFFDSLSDDMTDAQKKLRAFIARLDEAERLDEKHLLPIALDVFGSVPFPLTEEYVGLKKNKRSTEATVARRLRFDRYYSFILSDFFEGLHHGHYPRRCPVCKSYFLMQSARRTIYCSGMSPYEVRGKRLTCRAYAAYVHRKELAEGDPVTDIYNRRCSVIRAELSRDTITPEFAAKAKALALEHKQRAQFDHEYAVTQYEKDMEREKLYHDAEH